MTAMEKNPGRIKSFFKDPIIAYAGVTVFCCRINNTAMQSCLRVHRASISISNFQRDRREPPNCSKIV